MTVSRLVVCMGGEAGFGIMSAGLTVARIANRLGYWATDYAEYPSIIRGGHNVMWVVISDTRVYSMRSEIDVLIAMNQETIDLHIGSLRSGGWVIMDSEKRMKVSREDVRIIDVPFNRLAHDIGGSNMMRNIATMGAFMACVGGELDVLFTLVREEFADKTADIIDKNIAVAQAAYDYVHAHFPERIESRLVRRDEHTKKIIVNGNQAIALGAIAAGMSFASIYPMTPTSSIIEWLAPYQEKYGYIYRQPEDEIAAINMAIGAAFAGARVMVATSGGGFCLMSEGLGLAGITETPLVIIMGMRPGPATGLPTWTDQGDLRFVLHASQGEFPRIVLAAGDQEEAFYLTMKAFNLAEKYQTPVILLMDKHLCECRSSIKEFSQDGYDITRGKLLLELQQGYKRFTLSEDGISPRSIVGVGNQVLANSDEHDEAGYSCEERENRLAQAEKRMQKLDICAREDMGEGLVRYGPEEARVTIVSWGSGKGVILEAMDELSDVNYIHLTWMSPFPAKYLKELLKKSTYILLIEQNMTAQLRGLIAEHTGVQILDTYLKYDGRPLMVEEIVEKISAILSS